MSAKPPVIRSMGRAWQSLPKADLEPSLQEAVGERVMAEISTLEQRRVPGSRARRPSPAVLTAGVGLAAAAAVALALVVPELVSPEEPAGMASSSLAQDSDSPSSDPRRTGPGAALEFVGTASSIEGSATLVRGDEMPVQIAAGGRVAWGDKFELGKDARVEIELPGVADLVLTEDTFLALDGADRNVALDLKRGSVTVRVDKRGIGEGFFVGTPAGRVEVTGTVFRVEVSQAAAVRVAVAEGTVMVRDLADTRNVVPVRAGFAFSVDWSDPRPGPLDGATAALILDQFEEEETLTTKPSPRATGSGGRWERLFVKAEKLRRERRTAEALKIYRRIAREAPSRQKRAEAWFVIAQLRYSTGDLEGAERALTANAGLLAGTPFEKMARSYLSKIRKKKARRAPARDGDSEGKNNEK